MKLFHRIQVAWSVLAGKQQAVVSPSSGQASALIDLRPQDRLVICIPRRLSSDQAESMRESVEEFLQSQRKVLIFDEMEPTFIVLAGSRAINVREPANREDRTTNSSAAALAVLAERRRQIEVEGWTPGHDDAHDNGSMAIAAACYALANQGVALDLQTEGGQFLERLWEWSGWDANWFKPGDTRRNLVKAGALILAEIERLDRKEEEEGSAS